MRRNARHSQAGLPGDWTVQPIRALGDVHGGSTPSRHVSRFWAGAIPWVTPGELTVLSAKYLSKTRECISEAGIASCGAKLLPKDTLLVTTRATLGAVALISTPTATNQGFKSIVFHDGSDPHFYFHLFHRLSPELARRASGTTFLEVSTREFGSIELPVPPLPEQRLIAEILDTVDLAIRKTEAMIAKLGQVKQGLLHDLLTRGIDDNGQLRDPDRHPEQFKDSPLGRIPKEWEVTELGRLLVHVIDFRGRTPRKLGMTWGGNIPALSAMNVQMGRVDLARDTNFGSEALYERWMTNGECRKGDVLVTLEAPLGNVAQVPNGRRYILSQRVVLLRFDARQITNDFAAIQMRSERFQENLVRWSTGTTATGIQRAKLVLVPILAPSVQEQRRGVEVVSALDKRLATETESAERLRLLKRGLMDDLLTGRVRVTSLLQQAAT